MDGLVLWAQTIMASPPDFWVGDEADPQLRRWYVVPKNAKANVFLHLFLKDDEVLHDHPFDSTSVLIAGGYREHYGDGSFVDWPSGSVVRREAETAHRIALIDGPAVSLFLTGPYQREWGFIRPGIGWTSGPSDPLYAATRHWRA
jgi:hypothetical protein